MKTKMTAIFATLMIALMAVGFAYAHWEKIITIEGTVNTGILHVSPSVYAETDDAKEYCTVETDVDGNTVYIDIFNAYPCITVSGWIDFENDGTIPVNLVGIECDGSEGLELVYIGEVGGVYHYEVYDDVLLIANLYLEADFPDGFPQIDPGETAYIYFDLHFKEDLPQDTSYWFTFEFTFWNWNEAP